jgi:hypothetical protein
MSPGTVTKNGQIVVGRQTMDGQSIGLTFTEKLRLARQTPGSPSTLSPSRLL